MSVTIKNGIKRMRSPSYNYNFRYSDGFFARWGATLDDDPDFSPYGCEIADIEISTICHGIGGKGERPKPCKHCYKSNTGIGENMSFETFKIIFDKLPLTLTQIALGIGDIDGNPDLWKIMDYCRTNGRNVVIPNITINGWNLTDEHANKLKDVCGAVAVSRYEPKDVCYNAVKKLTDLGMDQINIHMLVAEETFDACMELVRDTKSDPRLAKLNAVVFLTLKQKGRGKGYNVVPFDKYKKLIKYCEHMKIRYGMDSCSAKKFLDTVKNSPKIEQYKTVAEACESTLFSVYLNEKGKMYPCSFTEGGIDFDGIDVTKVNNFLRDVWYAPQTIKFRKTLLDTTKKNALGCRECPVFTI